MTAVSAQDRLGALAATGVSIWLDDLTREILAGGELDAMIAGQHVVGVTTNPTIFASALSKGDRYTSQLADLAARGVSVEGSVFAITTDDVREGCRALRAVYDDTEQLDGRVSIEVDPRLARDTDATIAQARVLWDAVGEPNLFVKIPATQEGLTAITDTISEGISVNVTLIFSLDRYRAVNQAYLTGLERAGRQGRDLAAIHSVASFFVSRVDSEVDRRLDALAKPDASALKGGAGIANARLAYREFEDITASERWKRLASQGANRQRPLWASTGVKDPAYPDTMYVTGLVAPHTVNTMPRATLEAFADHGTLPTTHIAGTYAAARSHLDALGRAGVDFNDVTETLEREGLAKFDKSWDELSHTVATEMNLATSRLVR